VSESDVMFYTTCEVCVFCMQDEMVVQLRLSYFFGRDLAWRGLEFWAIISYVVVSLYEEPGQQIGIVELCVIIFSVYTNTPIINICEALK
jgi:hypothetical protein